MSVCSELWLKLSVKIADLGEFNASNSMLHKTYLLPMVRVRQRNISFYESKENWDLLYLASGFTGQAIITME